MKQRRNPLPVLGFALALVDALEVLSGGQIEIHRR
jgi:hypothetical protein